ncbi:DNA mismatch repair protein [Phytophthora palmivora]|uniref:DNA mismatch repair protein n=1 Tax=Phytophthora palmivora TaxID=4796 RepID=A0A2P4YLS7_9STRA|nr:DNA mismatch repair protein [Phytophthora palmivora]
MRIQRLSPDVVNRIAAGEVVHRPANAVKELLENALDAGATHVAVTVSQGGLKLLQIQDNGRGIQRQDLEIVCERFTTSKLKSFEDLKNIQSFGFRGEALASISHVAHVTITSRTADQPCAYNTRKQALKNASEQYNRILDVVQKYAIHFGAKGVGFVCKKHRESSCGVNTTQSSSQLEVIRAIYGSKLANELTTFEHIKDATAAGSMDLQHQVRGYISNANYHLKKSNFILFINDRLVECPSLKRACDMKLPPRNIDVNVHPTKREVHFLHEEDIVDAISQAIERQLKGSNESRSFSVQPITAMLGISSNNSDASAKQRRRESVLEEEEKKKEEESSDEEMHKSESENEDEADQSADSIEIDLSQKPTPPSKKYQAALPEDEDDRRGSLEATQTPQMLSSVQNLLSLIRQKKNKALARLFREHSFVGVVNKQFSLVQYRTKLYIARHDEIAFHVFYQQVLLQFGETRPITLQSPFPIYDLVLEALKNPRNGYDEEDGPREQLADEIKTLLITNGPMLFEYFSIDIDSQGMLRTLPQLLPDHEPSIHSLPEFVFHLATEVNWEEEEPCFESVAQVLARWYGEMRYPGNPEREVLVLEHVLFPATKAAAFCPPNELNNAQLITPVACLTNLYKIFERC